MKKKSTDDQKRKFLHQSFKILMGLTFDNNNQENNSNIVGMGTLFKAFALFPKTLDGIIKMRGGAPTGFYTTVNLTTNK